MNCFLGSERLHSKIFYLQRIGLDFNTIQNMKKSESDA